MALFAERQRTVDMAGESEFLYPGPDPERLSRQEGRKGDRRKGETS